MESENSGVMRDSALERISGHMRKAVSMNKSELGDLKSAVSQIRKERHRSVSSMTKQQQLFLKKQAKILPALRLKAISKTGHSVDTSIRANSNDMRTAAKVNSKPFPVLPPISGMKVKHEHSEVKVLATDTSAKMQNINQGQCLSVAQKVLSRSLPEIINDDNLDGIEGHNLSYSIGDLTPAENLSARVRKLTTTQAYNLTELDPLHFSAVNKNRRKNGSSCMDETQLNYSVTSLSDNTEVFGREMQHDVANNEERTKSSHQHPGQLCKTSSINIGSTESELTYQQSSIGNQEIVDGSEGAINLSRHKSANDDAKRRWEVIKKSLKYVALMGKSEEVEKLYQDIRSCRYIRKHPKQVLEDESCDAESISYVSRDNGHPKLCPCYLCATTQL